MREDVIRLVPGCKDGIDSTISDIEEQMIQRYNNKLVKAQKEWQAKKITFSAFQEKQAKLALTYLNL